MKDRAGRAPGRAGGEPPVYETHAGPRLAAGLALLLLAIAGGWSVLGGEARPLDPTSVATFVDVNAADAARLRLLPGVGPTLAERIVEHRRAEGAFESLADLERVHRIGPRTVVGLTPFADAGR